MRRYKGGSQQDHSEGDSGCELLAEAELLSAGTLNNMTSKMDAMLGSRGQFSKPQQMETTAAPQQPLFAPVSRSTGQSGLPGMDAARIPVPPPAFASVPTDAQGLFRAAQMPMHPAANPMTLHLYQTLMAASMMGAGAHHPLQEGTLLTSDGSQH